MKARRLSSWGLATALVATIGCSSGGGNSTGTGGHAGSTSTGTGGHAGMGGHAGTGTGGSLGGAGGTSNGGAGGTSNGGAGGTSNGGAGGKANGGAGGTSNGGAGGASNGGAGGAVQQSSDFKVTLSPTTATVAQGATQDVTVTIDRNVGTTAFTGAITLSFSVPSAISTTVTGTFDTNPVTQGGAKMTITVGATAAVGTYTVNVVGTAAGNDVYTATLSLTVAAPATIALVDADNSDNNDPANTNPTPSNSDTLFASWLQNETITNYNTKVVQGDTDPGYDALKGYQTIIWYTGDITDAPSADQETDIQNLIDAGGKTIILFDERLMWNDSDNDWTSLAASHTLTNMYLGGAGAVYVVSDMTGTDLTDGTSFTASGATSTPFAGLTFTVSKDTKIGSYISAINPASSSHTDVLVTVQGDPAGTGTNVAVPVVVGRKGIGAKGTSNIIFVGIPAENIHGSPTSTAQQFFHAVMVYAGLKAS